MSVSFRTALRTFMSAPTEKIEPARLPHEVFELYSIPAYDAKQPEIVRGREVGSTKQIVQAGDVLLSKIVPHIRRAWVVRPSNGRRLIASSEWLVFRGEGIHPPYLRHVLVGNDFHAEFMRTVSGVGGSLLRARPRHVATIEIPVPLLPEQRRIADILDRADELRVKRRTATTLIGTVSDSLFVEMFCGRESHYWQETPVAALAADVANAIRTGPFGSQLLHSEFVDSGIAVLGIDNAVQNTFVWGRPRFITERKYRQLQRYTVRPGDVLVTIMGTCGRCAVVPENIPTAINTKHLCCITLNTGRCLPVYLQACLLKHPRVLHQLGVRQRGAVMPGLNMQLIKQLRIPEAPMPLQREFARLVSALETVEERNRASDKNLNTLIASLQHRAFRGEL